MNVDIKDLNKVAIKFVDFIKKYRLEFFLIIVGSIFAFLVIQISQNAIKEPTQEAIDDKIKTVQIPKIDQDAISKIEQLEDLNIEVKAIFNEARNNPFCEVKKDPINGEVISNCAE